MSSVVRTTGAWSSSRVTDFASPWASTSTAADPLPTARGEISGGPRAQGPPEISPRAVGKGSAAVDVLAHGLAKSVTRLLDHAPVVRTTDDIEAVHQARVATRRLRSDLRTYGDLLDSAWASPLRDEL